MEWFEDSFDLTFAKVCSSAFAAVIAVIGLRKPEFATRDQFQLAPPHPSFSAMKNRLNVTSEKKSDNGNIKI